MLSLLLSSFYPINAEVSSWTVPNATPANRLIYVGFFFRYIFPVVFILSPYWELFQMSEGAQESLLTHHTDAEVLGKPMAHLSKVMIIEWVSVPKH